MLYVVAAVVVPIALMCAMLIMERLEQRILGSAVRPEGERSAASPPAVPQPSPIEQKVVAEPPRAA
ncbi:MAG TPA: hypothetical protein VGE11_04805 [Pseudonocardia sp.]